MPHANDAKSRLGYLLQTVPSGRFEFVRPITKGRGTTLSP
jgi:hypothetical protein